MPDAGRALLCLVTDRRRLASRLGCEVEAVADQLVAQVGAAAEAGLDLVQIREGDLPAAALADLTRRVLARLRGTSTRVVVNDRVDVALASRAHGAHLKAASVSPWQARGIAPAGWLIGTSVHGADLARARGADYLIAGTILSTPSKPAGSPLLGFDGLHAVVRAAQRTPVLGIGGLRLEDVAALRRAGASGLAGIDVFLPESGAHPDTSVHRAVSRLRLAFDSAVHVS